MKNCKKNYTRLSYLLLTVVLLFALVGCTAGQSGNDTSNVTESATVSTEATDTVIVTEPSHSEETEATEPSVEETEAEETTEATEETKATKPTEKPHKHDYTIKDKVEPGCYADGYTVYWCTCGDSFTKTAEARGYHNWTEWTTIEAATTETEGVKQRSCKDCETTETKTIGKLTPQVKPTEPKPTEPKPTEPKVPETKPAETQPSHSEETQATEPAACQHSWQEVHHAEKGHEEHYIVCKCGYRCKSNAEWLAHAESYSREEQVSSHGSCGSADIYVVDSPAYTEWVCSKCGATTTTKP